MKAAKVVPMIHNTLNHTKKQVNTSEISLQDNIFWNIFLLISGSVICSWAINCILLPHHFLSGGITGIALMVHYIFPGLSVGMLYFIINIPIFILGWLYVGRRFFYYSIAGLLIFSGTIIWVKGSCPVQDKILAALLAGIVYGAGSGIILRSLGSAGGTDIFSIILLKKFSIRVGSTVLFFNAGVLALSVFIFSVESVLYTLIFMYVSSRIIDLVLSGLSQRKAVLIISPKWEEISQIIMKKLNRGVTFIPAMGGYSGKTENLLYTVVTFRELSRLKDMVYQTDPNPFVVVSDTIEVIGQRIGNQPHW